VTRAAGARADAAAPGEAISILEELVELGLGSVEKIDGLEIRWPSGTIRTFKDLPVDRRLLVLEGQPWTDWELPSQRAQR